MNNDQTPPISESEKQRVVRVFISSTFCDMQAEREQLVKFTFPELRRRCREREVEFVDVDLRWGIPDEQKAEGKVLPICLAEIERSRPYFIGLLGEHYGWVPEKIDKELIKEQGWLAEHKEKSITELEIVHGVLSNPKMKQLAFFYFRDPEKSKQIEADLVKKPDYIPDTEISHIKLLALKKEITESGYLHREKYSNAQALGQKVLDDLWSAIDKRFPIAEKPSDLERERMEHEAFAAARTKVYIGSEEYFKRLDEHLAGDGLPLILLGESGSGKSALMANWVKRYRKDHPDDFMVLHFIGSTPDSADYVRLLRRIMEEIRNRYEPSTPQFAPSPLRGEGWGEGAFSDDIPTDPKKIVEAFPRWLAKAAARGRMVLVLDALNQLEDRDNAPDLGWLPEYFPPNIRVILSTLPGRSLEAIKKRNYQTLTVQPIDTEEKKKFIKDYLKQYRKELSKEHTDRVASLEQSSNPLYLRTLLEELRLFGIHEELDNKITHYLKAEKVDDLFELVLERLEQDYDRDHPGLVRDSMSLIWASRNGLSETELLELLGSKEEPLLRAYWSPLYLALEASLVSRSGLLNFFHDFLRKAIEDKYLQNKELKQEARIRLADYFEKRKLDDRKVDEFPWQLCQAESWQRLNDCIRDMGMFQSLTTEEKKDELIYYYCKKLLEVDPSSAATWLYKGTVLFELATRKIGKGKGKIHADFVKYFKLSLRLDPKLINNHPSKDFINGICELGKKSLGKESLGEDYAYKLLTESHKYLRKLEGETDTQYARRWTVIYLGFSDRVLSYAFKEKNPLGRERLELYCDIIDIIMSVPFRNYVHRPNSGLHLIVASTNYGLGRMISKLLPGDEGPLFEQTIFTLAESVLPDVLQIVPDINERDEKAYTEQFFNALFHLVDNLHNKASELEKKGNLFEANLNLKLRRMILDQYNLEAVMLRFIEQMKNRETRPGAILALAQIGRAAVTPLVEALKDKQAQAGACAALTLRLIAETRANG